MLAELVDHVIGIDPDKDWITAAIVEADTTRFIEIRSVQRRSATATPERSRGPTDTPRPANGSGRSKAQRASVAGSPLRLSSLDEWVIEFDWARQKATKDAAKSDELDAVRGGPRSPGTRPAEHPTSPRRPARSTAGAHACSSWSSPSSDRSDQRAQSARGHRRR